MPVFAITGNLGSGKSTVCTLLAQRGARVFDADAYVHRAYRNHRSPIYNKVAATFPRTLIRGTIDRRALGALVFSDSKARMRLERIVHPPVTKALRAWCVRARAQKRIAIAEVPLLFEKKLEKLFDAVIVVYVPYKILHARVKKQRGYSSEYIRSRLALYLPLATKFKQADFIIDNGATRARLHKEIDTVWKNLRAYASRAHR